MTAVIGVYVCTDRAGQPVYIGASRDVERRIPEHSRKPWWPRVIEVERYPMETWEQALHVERNLIRMYSPEGNRKGVDEVDWAINSMFGPMFADIAGMAD